MHTIRTLAALAIGATLALGITAGCATGPTPEAYVSDMRDVMPADEEAAATDDQILQIGRALCAMPEALNLTADTDATPAYTEMTRITAEYCPVLGTDPGTTPYGVDTAAAEAPPTPEPAPIVLGQPIALNYGGTEDVATWTVNSAERCGDYLALDITLTTGQMWQPGGTDGVLHRTSWTDTAGITHDGGTIMAFDCGEQLVSPYSAQPGKTYRGVQTFDIPAGQLASLDITDSAGAVHTYTPEA